jgi:hypothetical protein
MPEKNTAGQADKAAAEQKTADVAEANRDSTVQTEAKSAAAKVLSVDASQVAGDPYPAYDLMTLDQLRELAKERNVEINRDVEKAHLITELRAADTQTR